MTQTLAICCRMFTAVHRQYRFTCYITGWCIVMPQLLALGSVPCRDWRLWFSCWHSG